MNPFLSTFPSCPRVQSPFRRATTTTVGCLFVHIAHLSPQDQPEESGVLVSNPPSSHRLLALHHESIRVPNIQGNIPFCQLLGHRGHSCILIGIPATIPPPLLLRAPLVRYLIVAEALKPHLTPEIICTKSSALLPDKYSLSFVCSCIHSRIPLAIYSHPLVLRT